MEDRRGQGLYASSIAKSQYEVKQDPIFGDGRSMYLPSAAAVYRINVIEAESMKTRLTQDGLRPNMRRMKPKMGVLGPRIAKQELPERDSIVRGGYGTSSR